jgi:RND family efflux transporter MFP subunit
MAKIFRRAFVLLTRPRQLITIAMTCGLLSTVQAHSQEFDCVIEPMALVGVVAPDKGRIASVYASRGDVVDQGDPLVQLDNELQQLQVDLASIQAASDIQVRANMRRLELREKELQRAITLQDREVATQKLVDDAEIEVALTSLTLEEAEMARSLSQLQLAHAKTMLSRRTIRSPVSGLVLSVEAHAGEYAHEQFILLTLARIDPLYVEAFLPAHLYRHVAVGDHMQVLQDPPFNGKFDAQVKSVDRVFDAASGTFGILLSLGNPDGQIPAGTRCRLIVDTD